MSRLLADKKEGFFVHADLKIGDRVVAGIPCKVFLPEKPSDKPALSFQPTREQYASVQGTFTCGFNAEIRGVDGSLHGTIEAPTVYLHDLGTTTWAPDLSVSKFEGDPQHLRVVEFLSGAYVPRTRCRVTWWLSPNKMLNPHLIVESSYTGQVRIERVFRHTFRLERHLRFIFDREYRSRRDDDEFIQWSFLVGTTRHALQARDSPELCTEILPKLDDFLLIVSLGSSTRTACLGWQAVDQARITRYYRGKLSFPTGAREPIYVDGLVSVGDFDDFAAKAYSAFLGLPDREPVRGAIYALVPGRTYTTERKFLSLFAALEMLLLDFRRRNSLEFVMSEEQWKTFKAACKEFLKEQTRATLDKDRRKLMYSKLDELNRVPLRAAFEELCRRHGIELGDLWPVFAETKDNVGLVDIRNMIIHGETLRDRHMDALWIATEHLRWTVERVVLALLKWPVERTEVSPDFLRRMAQPMIRLPAVRQTFESGWRRRHA